MIAVLIVGILLILAIAGILFVTMVHMALSEEFQDEQWMDNNNNLIDKENGNY